MTNKEIARNLALIADVLELKGADPFEIRAYQQASRAVEFQTKELYEVVEKLGTRELEKISGIGRTISHNIEELVKTGRCRKLEGLVKRTPPVMLEMLAVPGMGPRTSKKLYQLLKPRTLADLKKKIKHPRYLKKLERASVLEKSIQKILRGIKIYQSASGRWLLSQALPLAEHLVKKLKDLPETREVEYVGSLRRRKETVGDIDIIASPKIKNQASKSQIINQFIQIVEPQQILAQGGSKATVVNRDGMQIDLEIMPQREWGSLMHHFTGSKEHNIKFRAYAERKGLSFSEHGFKKSQISNLTLSSDRVTLSNDRVKSQNHNSKSKIGDKISIYCPREEDVFRALRMQYIPPELREGMDEIEKARSCQIPKLVDLKDIRGDLQLHSRWSDGKMTILEMAQNCRKKGYQYLAMSDHSAGLGIIRAVLPGGGAGDSAARSAGGIGPKNYQKYLREIDKVNKRLPAIRVFSGIEVNIRPDGSLDQPNELLEKFEIVLAGVHSSLSQPKDKTTQRLIRVLRNPAVDGIVHPSTRIIDQRPEIQVDWRAVFQEAVRQKKVLEINGAPNRLDLKDIYIKKAQELGVKFIISTDAHTASQLDFMEFGVFQARRGWLTRKEVVNTLPLNGLKKFFGIK